MEANELRIGNWVFDCIDQKEIQFDYDDFQCLSNYHVCNHANTAYKSIPLTKEWLLKCGGEKRTGKERGFWFRIEEYEICISENYLGNGWFISIKTGFGSQPVTIIREFVHEWQNLYYALTGKELTINQ